MPKVQAVATIIAAGTSNAASGTTRGVLDVRGVDGGLVTLKITNGATGPTAAGEMRVLIAHNTGATPTAGAAGADWKTVHRFNGGTTANDVTESHWRFGPEVTHIEVEAAANTGQPVTVEALASTFTYT